MNVWILQTGEPLHIDSGSPRPMRAMNLANELVNAGHNVTVFSSDFSHSHKNHRYGQYQEVSISERLQYKLIPSPGYQGHMGLKRLYDHWIMGWNLRKLLKQQQELPDVVFVGFPPIEVAYFMTRWLKKRNIPCLIDVKDQWPVIFVKALPGFAKPIGRILFSPYFYMAKKAINNATGVSAMAQGFLDWALTFAGRGQHGNDKVVPLTPPQQPISNDDYTKALAFWRNKLGDVKRTKVVFIGTPSTAFDMEPIIKAASYFGKSGSEVDFVICGEGPMTKQWQDDFSRCDNVYFPGWIDQAQISVLLENSLAVLAPYISTDDFMISVPNKVVDALSHGKPILTGLKGEVEALVKKHRTGLFYASNESSLEQCIETLLNDATLVQEIQQKTTEVYQQKYEFNRVYQGLVEHLTDLAMDNRS